VSDISAVVLTLGEETTERALESARRQTLPPKEIIVIRNVTPFHKALNQGVSKVKSEFFIQLDSDMVLDETCLQDLRDRMEADVGLVMGQLRDPLIGRVGWIKMFRTKCFEHVTFKDVISTDVAFMEDIAQYGWKTLYALRPACESPKELWHTFGEHRPSYTPHYTFSKYLLEGRKYRYRRALGALLWHFQKLHHSTHKVSLVAQIALSHGIFIREEIDLLTRYSENKEFNFLESFLETARPYRLNWFRIVPFLRFNPEKAFQETYRLGVRLRHAQASPSFQRCLKLFNNSRDPLAWIAKVGLCHGLFSEAYREHSCAEDYKILKDFIGDSNLVVILKNKLRGIALVLHDFIVSCSTADLARRLIKRSWAIDKSKPMNRSEQKQLVENHFRKEAVSWSARYADDMGFKNYNFIVRREHVLQLFDKRHGRYLDAGCGTGDFLPALLERGGDVFAIDVAAEMISQAKARLRCFDGTDRIHLSVADVTNLDFPESYFDAIISVGLVEYLSNDEAVLEELYRVLKPGGILIITVPNLASPFMAFDTLVSHGRRFMKRVLAWARGHDVSPTFIHRHFFPWRFDRQLTQVGFRKIDYRFCTYGFFSAQRTNAMFLALSRKLDRFSCSALAILGTNYIVKVEKP
jgi:ubiquinone/menaquinone biosynthesis C-methylase UbiE